MARVLVSTTAVTGHVNPFLPIVQELVQRGHTVGWYTSEVFREVIERAGATFFPIKEAFDAANRPKEILPHLQELTGLQSLIADLTEIFINPAPQMLIELEKTNDKFNAEVLISDETSYACGFLREKMGLPHIIVAVTIYSYQSKDTAPLGMGLLPMSGPIGRLRNMLLNFVGNRYLLLSVVKAAEQARLRAGLKPIPGGALENVILKPDRYLLSTVPMFEYSRSDLFEGTRFIGLLMNTIGTRAFTRPRWWKDLSIKRPVIHITQGTARNAASELLFPAIQGLAQEDMLVVGTTGGKSLDTIPLSHLAPNTRLETFIPYTELMPHVDVMVTNGGYGGVQQALAHGVPLVVAGATEEKMDIAARVQQLGAGINLRAQTPKPDLIRQTVKRVLNDPAYRWQAERIQEQYKAYDAPKLAVQYIEEVL